jgi:hypothetical protein
MGLIRMELPSLIVVEKHCSPAAEGRVTLSNKAEGKPMRGAKWHIEAWGLDLLWGEQLGQPADSRRRG